ncbi:hypothetical protein [Methylobacterium sp. V23]|jgi:hypothetical protein|uniref:hypothetical protein n=1 Tax=Methylobacterium sp. V23 TaxID=2044878 RepID=UPI000CDB7B9A|nr:hypothetical protein [Methylobacterium sp. V23]POR40434.1 hypothetical protein CRT23_23720 [Methylobacterium sp. V23]
MITSCKLATLVLAGGTMLMVLSGASLARDIPGLQGHYMSGQGLAAPTAYRINPQEFEADEDFANAHNPALLPYQRGRGQETGGGGQILFEQ